MKALSTCPNVFGIETSLISSCCWFALLLWGHSGSPKYAVQNRFRCILTLCVQLYVSISVQNYRFQVLPTWNNTDGGALAFKFRTNEPDGLIFYNGGGAMGQVGTKDSQSIPGSIEIWQFWLSSVPMNERASSSEENRRRVEILPTFFYLPW